MLIWILFRWNLGSGGVCNRWEMAVGFKWADSQLISSHMDPFSKISMILMILLSFSMVWRCFREVPEPPEGVLRLSGRALRLPRRVLRLPGVVQRLPEGFLMLPGPSWRLQARAGGLWARGCPTVENPWNLHRISMESPSNLHGISIESPSHPQRAGPLYKY